MPDTARDAALSLVDSLREVGLSGPESHKVLGVSRTCLKLGGTTGAGLAVLGWYGGPKAAALAFAAGALAGTASCELVRRMSDQQLADLRATIAGL